ncbi:E1-like protein-activating [Hesseltinella vesiculosa]|uniref:Ubiquitin-like modifier-activating enzyme ATG7 n=1 Tax=Hesseltinella vesiculosa TaxID=101127 RepID=A0A1X2GWG0_9FUNG|nr:E1-like protein-activating [Hesseltinella vesiculosa]
MATLQFTPFQSAVDASFWLQLVDKKLNVLRLSQDAQPLTAYYALARAALPSLFTLPDQALDAASVTKPPFTFVCHGQLHNTNTMEEFTQMNKAHLTQTIADQIWQAIIDKRATHDPTLLTPFCLLTFADLKKSRFYYWFAFPALVPSKPWLFDTNASLDNVWSSTKIESLVASFDNLGQPVYFRIDSSDDVAKAVPLSAPLTEKEETTPLVFGFADPSSSADHPGWPARNLLAWVHFTYPNRPVQVLAYRERPGQPLGLSRLFSVSLPSGSYQPVKCVGWERNEHRALAPRMVDLAHMLDPALLASNAVDLNLKLMRWRLMPDLDLETIKATKCLLLGAGTLGCYVARSLMGWGVRHITFVDNGKVSMSNPVRQPLYRFEDALQGGQDKAATAAQRLLDIQPTMITKGISMTIPMPGHPQSEASLTADTEQLQNLIKEHDVVYLLTDSRESRWLPTLLARIHDKLVMNAALGFDSYVVMRHGTPTNGLGCYYCHDIVAPTDSLKDRTLDQQCTVTRPGLSAIAAALAVELMVMDADAGSPGQPATCLLGIVPHQIRGFLGQFNNMMIVGQSYEKCTACSKKVMDAFIDDPWPFLKKVTEDSMVLEQITGLDEMKKQSEALLEEDWALGEDDDISL